MRQTEDQMGVTHPTIVGNGNLTLEEAVLIEKMDNIDVIGGNFYNAGIQFGMIFDTLDGIVNKPLIVSEFAAVQHAARVGY